MWESIASLLSYVSEFVVLDLGSTDGTYPTLLNIAQANPKFKIIQGEWTKIDAGVFADLANRLISECKYENVLYYQADEIWHPNLLKMMGERFDKGEFDLAFWRIQFKYNWQHVKWFPHPVHRVGPKSDFVFVDDGMNSNRTYGVDICSEYNQGWFQKWGTLGGNIHTAQNEIKPYVNQMITDVSQVGAFLNTIVDKRRYHAPFWGNEGMAIEGKPASVWYDEQVENDDWIKQESPYEIPKVLQWHLGRLAYIPRPELIQAIKDNDTQSFVFD